MKIEIIGREDWHLLRGRHVGASEVSALFGKCPYTTLYELWHVKSGLLKGNFKEDDRMFWGTQLESAIAFGIAKKENLLIRKADAYYTSDVVEGMGATPDFFILDPVRGKGCFEVKNVDRFIFMSDWINDTENLEAPYHIELQLQQQLACTGCQWGAFGVLVGGNEYYYFERERHDKIISQIEDEIRAFWESIDKGIKPMPEKLDDYSVAKRLYGAVTEGWMVPLSEKAEEWAFKKVHYSKILKEAKTEEAVNKALLLEYMGKAERAISDNFEVIAKCDKNGVRSMKVKDFRNGK